jgi:hypothetical protein
MTFVIAAQFFVSAQLGGQHDPRVRLSASPRMCNVGQRDRAGVDTQSATADFVDKSG